MDVHKGYWGQGMGDSTGRSAGGPNWNCIRALRSTWGIPGALRAILAGGSRNFYLGLLAVRQRRSVHTPSGVKENSGFPFDIYSE